MSTNGSASTTRDAASEDQDVTPFELFFDLVFVFAFTQVTDFLVELAPFDGRWDRTPNSGVLPRRVVTPLSPAVSGVSREINGFVTLDTT